MQLRKAERRKVKIKLALQGVSGSGKTMSALLLAFGMTGDWEKIAVIDTENNSADLYAHLGEYLVLPLSAPYSPENYIKAIKVCENAGIEVIVIDSISHEWEGVGGILHIKDSMSGNSYTNWGKLTPRHNKFIQKILQSNCHIISTIRTKQDYVLEKNEKGKQVPRKVGMKGITREGMDYEFTCVLDIDLAHFATASKDRTGLFMDEPDFKITSETGTKLLEWCNTGVDRFKQIQEEKEAAIDAVKKMDLKELGESKITYAHLLEKGSPLNIAMSVRYKELIELQKSETIA